MAPAPIIFLATCPILFSIASGTGLNEKQQAGHPDGATCLDLVHPRFAHSISLSVVGMTYLLFGLS
jgi:hypothetical protein